MIVSFLGLFLIEAIDVDIQGIKKGNTGILSLNGYNPPVTPSTHSLSELNIAHLFDSVNDYLQNNTVCMASTVGSLALEPQPSQSQMGEGSPLDKYYTYADYKEWELSDNERYELIYGEAYAMSAPNTYHQLILMELSRQIANYLIGKPCKVYPAPFDVRLFYEEDGSDDTVVQPDVSIICDRKKIGPEGGRSASDFIAEILSPSNTAIEMLRKFELYRKAEVCEYWVFDPEHKNLHVYDFKDNAIFPHTFRSTDSVKAGIFPDLEIALEPVFAG